MSRLDELIAELCPDGVKFCQLSTIFDQFSGMGGVTNKWADKGNCHFIDYMNAYKHIAIDVNDLPKATVKKLDQTVLKQGDILFTSASETPDECAISSVIEDEIEDGIFLDDHLFGLRIKSQFVMIISPSYLKYAFRTTAFRTQIKKAVRGVTRFFVSKTDFMKLSIPIPPLPVQHEIVRILDSFTDLTAELTAELAARKKQYEYYKYQLLFTGNVNKRKIREIAELHYGQGNKIPTIKGEYPVYGCKGVVGTTNKYNSEDSSIIGHIGSAGCITWGKGKHYVTYNGTICKGKKDICLSKYLYYILTCLGLEKRIKGNQPFLSISDFDTIEIPLPDIHAQKRIVNLLDRFDMLCNDIIAGLPAEVNARQKQYEYFRDKLLTFKRAEVLQ